MSRIDACTFLFAGEIVNGDTARLSLRILLTRKHHVTLKGASQWKSHLLILEIGC
jgi:hypothetical protein